MDDLHTEQAAYNLYDVVCGNIHDAIWFVAVDKEDTWEPSDEDISRLLDKLIDIIKHRP